MDAVLVSSQLFVLWITNFTLGKAGHLQLGEGRVKAWGEGRGETWGRRGEGKEEEGRVRRERREMSEEESGGKGKREVRIGKRVETREGRVNTKGVRREAG